MASTKPLPQLPSSAVIPRLTIEASEHLNSLVAHAVQQRGLHVSWILPIQTALESLATWMSRGEWLKGIYAERRRKRAKGKEAAAKESKPLTKRTESAQSVAPQSVVMVELPGTDDSEVRIRRLFELISKTETEAICKHLLLTVNPPETDSPVDTVPAHPNCTFHEGGFHLPYFKHIEGAEHGWGGTILCGLDNIPDHTDVTVIGGSFAVQGVLPPAMFDALVSVLSIGTFTVLSLGLELTLLRDSGVQLRYSVVPPVTLQTPPVPTPLAAARIKARTRQSKAGSGLWGFLTKTTENIIHRSRTISLDASSRPPNRVDGSQSDGDITPTPSTLKKNVSNTFSSIVENVNLTKNLLSTSPGVEFPTPKLLQDIAEKEKPARTVSLTAVDETGLSSILGWTGRREDFLGPESFLRHQSITTIYSEHPYTRQKPGSDENAEETLSFATCSPARWRTYQYYAKDKAEDQTLGELVEQTCGDADQLCVRPDCKAKRGDHELRWVHHRTKVVGRVKPGDETEGACIWVSCPICEAATERQEMAEGTFLLSFAKYLELLIYSPFFVRLSPPLCEHTSSAETSRFNTLRHFSYKSYVLTLTSVAVPDVFAVRPPRLQILRPNDRTLLSTETEWRSEERHRLRLEITMWWKGVKDHIVQLEDYLEGGNSTGTKKKLPAPPPPEAEAEGESTSDAPTPKARPAMLPRSASSTSQASQKSQFSQSSVAVASTSTGDLPPTGSVSSATSAPVVLLANLRQAFQATEQALYISLNKTPVSSVNDVRRLFLSSAKAASKRLAAWQAKHASGVEEVVGTVYYPEPEWWAPGSHSLPGGSVVVREGEWASVIAFTLSSNDYLNELQDMSVSRVASTTGATAGSDVSVTSSIILSQGSISSSASTISEELPSVVTLATPEASMPGPSIASFLANMHALATSRSQTPVLDPDDDSIAEQWHEQESWTAQISRKEHPKDPTSLLSLRDVLRNKPSFDSTALSSRFTQIGSSASRLVKGTTSKPTVEVSEHVIGAIVVPQPDNTASIVQKLLLDVEENMKKENANSADFVSFAAPTPTRPTIVETTLQRANNTSVVSSDSNATIKASTTTNSLIPSSSFSSIPPPVPPKTPPPVLFPSSKERVDRQLTSDNGEHDKGDTPQETGPGTTASTIGSLTSHLATAMRYVLSGGQTEVPSRPETPVPNHHPLLAGGSPAIDERPHIKYEWVIGKRLKFSCTVFYAKQFDSLRRRCGVDEILVQSLKRSENWAAEGGKSKSNFWKTSDDRFIIKTLVNAWNVADLQVLIDLGPSYFRYMDATTHRPSVLAKLLGFYTVEIKNLETNTIQSKADLLIMENLFFEQNISQTFDLKGIQGRKVKSNTSGSAKRTLFDGEWIEGQKKSLILVHPHSKRVLEEAIRTDADFLSRSNIMDYSLLLGVDLQQKQICCGLVDTIGSYTFAKTLEYKAKQNIKKDVTVIPPAEYQERFVKAIDTYFVACPDKWSDPGPAYSPPSKLPSVL